MVFCLYWAQRLDTYVQTDDITVAIATPRCFCGRLVVLSRCRTRDIVLNNDNNKISYRNENVYFIIILVLPDQTK